MAYTVEQISVKEIAIERITNLEIQCEEGQHSTMLLEGYIKNGEENKVLYYRKAYESISIYLKKKISIFMGILTNITIHQEGNLFKIKLEAKSKSILLDQKKKSRSFQRTSMTYEELAKKIISEYPNTEVQYYAKGKAIGQIAIQYQETDWEFLKRMCSELHAPITCRVQGECTQIYIGVPNMKKEEFSYQTLGFKKKIGEYDYWKQQGQEVLDSDFFVMTIQTNHIPEIFETILYKGKTLVIRSYKYILKNGILFCSCEVQAKKGILEKVVYPMHLIGVALNSHILKSQGTQVRVHFDMDGKGSEDVHWFDFSTLSASKDGSGWYYMPEKGDQVRIYFPSKYMKDAIAISAVNNYSGSIESSVSSLPTGGGSNPDRMSDPSTKYLSNANGQEMKMSEEGIFLSCAGGSAMVQIGNDGTITLQSAKNIEIQAQNNVSMEAEDDVLIQAKESAVIACAKGGRIQFLSDGNLKIQGTEVKIN